MASVKFHYYLWLLVLIVSYYYGSIVIVSVAGVGDHNKCLVPKEQVALFVFGDSLFDAGNNNYINTTADNLANYPPYGQTFFNYPTGRFSDGRVIPDFIAEYAKLPLIQPYLFPGGGGYEQYMNGVNFASAGAGALVETNQGLVIDLKSQLSNFKKVSKVLRQKVGDEDTKTLLAKAVYLISIGGNDYSVFSSSSSSSYTSLDKYVDMVVGNLTSVIQEIYKRGGRKFGVLNQPPQGCFPVIKAAAAASSSSSSCIQNASQPSILHNTLLSAKLHNLNKHLKGFQYSLFDFFHLAFHVINNPSKYGFKEGGVACCGSGPYRGYYSCGGKRQIKDYELCHNPSEYVFFDSVHPTQKAATIVSHFIWTGNQTITGPYNLKTLFQSTII